MSKKRSWSAEKMAPNVIMVRFHNVKGGWRQRVLLTGDRHHDNIMTDQALEREHLEEAKREDAPVIDIGDLFCAMQGKYDPRKSYTNLRPEHVGDDYFDLLVNDAEEFYRPYASQFVVLGRGNHEESIKKRQQTDLIWRLSRRLRRHSGQAWPFAGGYAGWIYFRFDINKTKIQTLRMKYHHGYGGGGPVTKGVIQTNRRAVYLPDANFVVTGHIHEAWVVPIRRERADKNGTLSLDYQHHVSVPTYKEEYLGAESGFHLENGRPPKPVGAAWLTFEWNKGRVAPSVALDLKEG